MSKTRKHCYIVDCPDEPIVICKCEKTPTLICKTHEIDHSKLEGKHHYDKLYIEIHEETKSKALKQFCKLKSDINLAKSKIIQVELSLINEIEKVTQKTLKSLKKQDQTLNEWILKAVTLKEIDNSKKATFIESLLKLSPPDLSKIQTIKSPELRINFINSDDIENLFELDEIAQEFINIDYPRRFMKYIWDCSSNILRTFDAKTLKEDKIILDLAANQMLDQYGAKCLLPDESLFYINGSRTIIIDPKCHIKTLLNYSELNFNACAIYKDREIYLFGGSHNASAKFSLAKYRWARLANIPLNLESYTFGAIYKNYILLGSINCDKILYYDTIIDSYNQVSSLTLTSSASKAFLVENETVYLIELSLSIYKSTDNLATWTKIGSCSMLSGYAPIISTPITYNKKFYFVNYYGVYSFDSKKKKIELIKRLDIPY